MFSDLLIRLRQRPGDLRKQRRQRLDSLRFGRLARHLAFEQAQIELETALNSVVQRQRQRLWRCGAGGHATLEWISLLAEQPKHEQQSKANGNMDAFDDSWQCHSFI